MPLREYFYCGNFFGMKLDEWLKTNNLTAAAFAAMSGLSQATISRTINGKRRPDWSTLDAITAATDGAVTPNDFVRDEAPDIYGPATAEPTP